MKVLFAVNNDNISQAVLKKYQQENKEIISYKNVYYFNAILKELQKDKSYDRVVVSEDLEPFANNNYDTIDKFLFEKLDKISDEATEEEGNETQVILICSDRRTTSDDMINKLFSIGLYDALIGQDRSIDEVCNLIKKPRNKKEAKQYYKVESKNTKYESEDEESVSESELQNILSYYRKIGKNEEKYVDIFNNIITQYTDAQLKIIIKYLPINVKAVLEERSPKYQELALGQILVSNKTTSTTYSPKTLKDTEYKKEEKLRIKMIEDQKNKEALRRPIVVPSNMTKKEVKKLIKQEEQIEEDFEALYEMDEEPVIEQPKRGRGRPKKQVIIEEEKADKGEKKGRGRPKKVIEEDLNLFELDDEKGAQKGDIYNESEDISLFDLDSDNKTIDETNDGIDLFNINNEKSNREEDITKVGIEFFDSEDNPNPKVTQEEYDDLFSLDENKEKENASLIENSASSFNDFSKILTKDKKIVSFVGTTKNGTSFVVNNIAELLSSMGIPTAILDMTRSKNAYYIYTNNEETLRNIASNSIDKLKSGIAEGVKVNKNLTIFTDLPGEEKDYSNVKTILETLVRNFSAILIDCDFNTSPDIFDKSQEIYLVQSMDVLTIQPLTAFLRNLKAKGVLKQEKIKIVINKEQKIRSLSPKVLIGGIAFYNDPAMSYMTELFNREKVQFCTIPFETQNYVKYLEALVNCSIKLNGYTKNFMVALKELADMVYPLMSRQEYSPRGDKYKSAFSNEMNDTLSKMKNNYQ